LSTQNNFNPVLMKSYAGAVIRHNLTIGKRAAESPMGLAPVRPELFQNHETLNFVGLTWSCESPEVDVIRKDLRLARELLPAAHFVILANTEAENWYLSRLGVPNFLANELIFVDDMDFTIDESAAVEFDAVYTARFVPFKRHELASKISSLLLLPGLAAPEDAGRIAALLPAATVLGVNTYFSRQQMAGHLNRARVGLALSTEEASMRAFMECLLCGLPIVTTKAIGGRMRYVLEPYVRVAEDNAEAVANAVAELTKARFPRLEVRQAALDLLAIERRRFMEATETIISATIGPVHPALQFTEFARFALSWRPGNLVFSGLS